MITRAYDEEKFVIQIIWAANHILYTGNKIIGHLYTNQNILMASGRWSVSSSSTVRGAGT